MGPSPPPRVKKCLRKPLWRYSRSSSTNSTRWRGWNSNNKYHGSKSHLASASTFCSLGCQKQRRITPPMSKWPGSQHISDSYPGRLLPIILRLAVLVELCSLANQPPPPPLAVACLSSLAITFPQASQMILWIRDHQGSHSKCSREG